jgi:hypothetical protein
VLGKNPKRTTSKRKNNLIKPEQWKQIIWYLQIIWEFFLTFFTNTIIFQQIEKEEKNGQK